jgi:hypothetical protein
LRLPVFIIGDRLAFQPHVLEIHASFENRTARVTLEHSAFEDLKSARIKIAGVNVAVKPFQKLVLGAVILIYGIWVYTGPLETLAMRYGDSGLTWGVLVFGLLIPYTTYIVFNIFQSWKKGKRKDSDKED